MLHPVLDRAIVGSVIVGKLLNWNYARVAKSIGMSVDRKRGDDLRKFPIERARLDLMWPWTGLAVAMLIAWDGLWNRGPTLRRRWLFCFFAGAGVSGLCPS